MTEEEVIALAQQRRGWSRERADAAVRKVMATNKWSLEQLYLGFKADFRCEYCGRDLLKSADDYKLWENDHIVRGAGDGLENLALACLVCNCKFKNRWRPSGEGGPGNRDALVAEAREYISLLRSEAERQVADLRATLR